VVAKCGDAGLIGGFRLCLSAMASFMEVMPDSTLEVIQRASLSEDQAEAIFEQGRDAVVFALAGVEQTTGRGARATSDWPC